MSSNAIGGIDIIVRKKPGGGKFPVYSVGGQASVFTNSAGVQAFLNGELDSLTAWDDGDDPPVRQAQVTVTKSLSNIKNNIAAVDFSKVQPRGITYVGGGEWQVDIYYESAAASMRAGGASRAVATKGVSGQ